VQNQIAFKLQNYNDYLTQTIQPTSVDKEPFFLYNRFIKNMKGNKNNKRY